MNIESKQLNKIIVVCSIGLIVIGTFFRLYQITTNQFIYYDEGMWLLQNQDFVRYTESVKIQQPAKIFKVINISFHLSLQTGKALWAFISQLRGLFVGAEGYYFTRVISALCGILTLGMVFLFSNRLWASRLTGIVAAGLLAILPSHVYYSRLALQEALSALLFLSGLYLYLFPKRLSPRCFIASICFAGVFFANYRMIVIPAVIVFCELYMSLIEGRRPNVRKYIYHTLFFFMLVFGIGAIDNGANTYVTFGWMFRQAHLAKGTFDFVNLFSYPYYVFSLESIIFACLLFGNVYFIVQKRWREGFAFALVMFFMVMFSFTQEKGVRYLTSAMPFMAMAVAILFTSLDKIKRSQITTYLVYGIFIVMVGSLAYNSFKVCRLTNDYEAAITDIKGEDPTARFVSTQSNIQQLYVSDTKDVLEYRYGVPYLMKVYYLGYRYLVIDPQAYVSYTDDGKRFSPKLKGYLEFINKSVDPVKTYGHFNNDLLKRFVFEHNENLRQSIQFLRLNKMSRFGQLKVYDIRTCIGYLQQGIKQYKQRHKQ